MCADRSPPTIRTPRSYAKAALEVNLAQEQKQMVRRRVGGVLDALLLEQDRRLECIREVTEHLLPRGIGVHHGGLLPVVRELTESLFQDRLGMSLVACGTPTALFAAPSMRTQSRHSSQVRLAFLRLSPSLWDTYGQDCWNFRTSGDLGASDVCRRASPGVP